MTNATSTVTPVAGFFESLGYRSIGPRSGELPNRANELAKKAADGQYHYDVQHRGAEHFLRRQVRRNGVVPEQLRRLIQSSNAASWAANKDVSFLQQFMSTGYARSFAKQLKCSPEVCKSVIRQLSGTSPSYTRIANFLKGIACCPADQLESILIFAFDIFFQWQPRGMIQVYMLSEAYESYHGFMRGAYTMEHCKPTDLTDLGRNGFQTLRVWHQFSAIGSSSTIFSQLDHFFYPYVTGFHGGPPGLLIHFMLNEVEQHQPGPWPPDWLAIPQIYSAFGGEQDDIQGAIQGNPAAIAHTTHHRYIFLSPPNLSDRIELEQWCIDRENTLTHELTDITNYVSDGFVDPIFAFEHALTIDRIRRLTLATNTLPFPGAMKGHVFAVADLYETICKIHGLCYVSPLSPPSGLMNKDRTPNYFKLLFHRSFAKQIMSECMITIPTVPRLILEKAITEAYDALVETVIGSVFMPGAKGIHDITVRGKSGAPAATELHEDFVANTMRALRNTHHGYLTKQDKRQEAPSRYLSIVDGNVTDKLSMLPSLWWLAFLGDPTKFAGVPILPIGQHAS